MSLQVHRSLITTVPFVNYNFNDTLNSAKLRVMSPESHSYLTGNLAAQLWSYLSNMNVIFDN